MTPSEFAARLNGREYMDEITRPEEAEAKAAGLVVMFGASDDNVELRGAVRDELSAIDGTTVRMTPHGPLQDWDGLEKDDEDDVEAYFVKKMAGFKEIEAEWSPRDEPSLCWRFKTEIPHATFEVIEDGEVFCRGIVFRLADVAGIKPLAAAPARMLTVNVAEPATGAEYVAGMWSRRNWEAAMRDQIAARTLPQGEAVQNTENPDHDLGAA